MQLTHEQERAYAEDGYLVLPGLLSETEVGALRQAYQRDRVIPGEHRVLEGNSDTIRAVYASHLRQPEFARLIRIPRLLGPVLQLLDAGVYIYQFKINSKAPFVGTGWSWHQDYAAWRLADNLPRPDLVNVGVFFDDISEFNGPVVVVPGSHRDALVKNATSAPVSPVSQQHVDPQDIALTVDDMTVLVGRHGMRSVTGQAGTVLLFHPELVHGSAANMSPFPRRLLIVTYNNVRNRPRYAGQPRPAYVVGRDNAPLEPADLPLADTLLVGSARRVPL